MRGVMTPKGNNVLMYTLADTFLQQEYERLVIDLVDGNREHDRFRVYLVNEVSGPIGNLCSPETGTICIPNRSSLYRYNESTQEIEIAYIPIGSPATCICIHTITGVTRQWMDLPNWLPDSYEDLCSWLTYNEDTLPLGYAHFPDDIIYSGVNVKVTKKEQALYINCPIGWKYMNEQSLMSSIKNGFLSQEIRDEIAMVSSLLNCSFYDGHDKIK